MTEQQFWDIIDQSRKGVNTNFETQCVNITELLLDTSTDAIIAFEEILRAQIEKANTWPVMAACFVVCSFMSDDTYEDFRAWLVGQGKANFDKILRDPNEICNLITPGQVKDMSGEHLLFAAVNAYMEVIDSDNEEDEIAFYEKINHPEEKEIEQKWPESKNDYRKMFPKLFDTFWNEDRIREKLEEAEAKGEI